MVGCFSIFYRQGDVWTENEGEMPFFRKWAKGDVLGRVILIKGHSKVEDVILISLKVDLHS